MTSSPPTRVTSRSAAASALAIDRERTREHRLWSAGTRYVAGVDEAGIGPLAGPVVAAAAILPQDFDAALVNDSKKLSHSAREELFDVICAQAVAYAVVAVDNREIDQLNIYQAGLTAMKRAVHGLEPSAGHALVDGRTIPDLGCSQTRLVKGDATEACIAAASILAKVTRDRIMVSLDPKHPGYDFAVHKGYPTAAHKAALGQLGPCPIHRMSFTAVREWSGLSSPLYYELRERAERIDSRQALESWRRDVRAVGAEFDDAELRRLRTIARRTFSG